jgi:hypothetical protein
METLTYAAPTGGHAVGVRDGEVLDATHPTMRPEDQQGRRLMVRVWYPASADAHTAPKRGYVVGDEAQLLTWFAEINASPQEWSERLGAVTTYSVQDAPALEGPFPAVLFSHGASSWVSQNTPLMEHLASHGYVVWSVAHPGEACGVHYPDGGLVREDLHFHETFRGLLSDPRYMDKLTGDVGTRLEATSHFLDGKGMGPWSTRWVNDLRAVIDAIVADSVTGPASDLIATTDASRLGVMGMSFGAAAAVSVAQQDVRVKAVVNLDGAQHLADLLDADVRLPLLHLASDMRAQLEGMGLEGVTALDGNEFFYEPVASAGARSDVHRFWISGLTHLEFTDLVLLPARERADVLPAGGGVESQRTIDLINSFVHAYFDAVLLGQDQGFPDRSLRAFPEVKTVDLSPIRGWARNSAHA